MKTRLLICVSVLFGLLSCSSSEREQLETALVFAGSNRAELEKVLEHYKDAPLKLQAAIYLIENMPLYYTYKGNDLDSLYIALGQYADSGIYDKHLEYLKQFPYRNLLKEYDAKVITSDYLIENIEYSFKVWNEASWGKSLSFDNFCEFILPYRIKDEPLTHWKKDFYHHFKPVLDSLYQGTDVVEATSCLSNYAANLHWKYQNELTGPHLSAHFLLERQIGDCTNIADFGCYILRSLGIPVLNTPRQIGSIRYTPRNDDNFIRVGDKYELFYFSADGWKSLGVKVAEESKLIYENVPSHALYWLRDLTRGSEEQVFTYYDNKQIFTEGYWNLLF